MRGYVNGVLKTCSTARSLPFLKTPSTIMLGGPFWMAWSGVIDEVRLSDIKRYGPFAPTERRWTPLAASAEPGASGAKTNNPPPVVAAKPAPDFAAGRKALIGKIPPPPADALVFDASQMKPLIQNDTGFAF